MGIWGDPDVTGKAAGNDILRRKKSLPLLYALNHAGVGETLKARLAQPIDADDLPDILEMLDEAGAKEFASGATSLSARKCPCWLERGSW